LTKFIILEKEIQIKQQRENKITLIGLKEENNIIFQNLLNESKEFFTKIYKNDENIKNLQDTLNVVPTINFDCKKFVKNFIISFIEFILT